MKYLTQRTCQNGFRYSSKETARTHLHRYKSEQERQSKLDAMIHCEHCGGYHFKGLPKNAIPSKHHLTIREKMNNGRQR